MKIKKILKELICKTVMKEDNIFSIISVEANVFKERTILAIGHKGEIVYKNDKFIKAMGNLVGGEFEIIDVKETNHGGILSGNIASVGIASDEIKYADPWGRAPRVAVTRLSDKDFYKTVSKFIKKNYPDHLDLLHKAMTNTNVRVTVEK